MICYGFVFVPGFLWQSSTYQYMGGRCAVNASSLVSDFSQRGAATP